MATGMQLPDVVQGLKAAPTGSAGASGRTGTGEGAAFGEQLAELEQAMRDAGLDTTAISPEMLALLQQWLAGGMSLPPEAGGDAPSGQVLPPGTPLQALVEWLAQSQEAGEGGDAPDVGALPSLPEGPAPGGVTLKAALREILALPAEAGRAGDAAAGGLPLPPAVSLPMASQAAPEGLPSRNLLAMSLPQPVTDPRWGAALGERLLWMAKGDQQQAELKISPPNLGPLEVKLTLNDDRASVTFVSHHALVRDAIEAALPRLREMLAQESLQLVQAEVSGGQAQGREAASGQGEGGASASPDGGEAEPGAGQAEGTVPRAGRGLLDLFA